MNQDWYRLSQQRLKIHISAGDIFNSAREFANAGVLSRSAGDNEYVVPADDQTFFVSQPFKPAKMIWFFRPSDTSSSK
jgi:hypothetical protein